MNDQELSGLLYEAMCIEKRAVRALGVVINASSRLADRELLAAVQREERRHYYLLEGLYEEVVGKPQQVNTVSVSLPKNFCDMLKTQICDKLVAVDFFEVLLPQLACQRQQELVQIILNDQKEHARILAGIYNRCVY